MTKLSKTQEKALVAVGVKATSVEEARKKLLALLKKEGVDEIDESSLEDLIQMWEAFGGDDDTVEEEVEVEDEEVEDEEVEDEDEEVEDDGIDEMGRGELKKYIKDNELNIVVKKSMTDDDLRQEIRDAMAVENDEDDEVEEAEEEEVVEKPKAAAKKTESKKTEPKKEKQVSKSKWDHTDPKHLAMLDSFKKIFKAMKNVSFNVVVDGISVYLEMLNSKKVLVRFCEIKLIEGIAVGSIDLTTLSNRMEVAEKIFKKGLSLYAGRLPQIKGVSVNEIATILTEKSIAALIADLEKVDKKLGENKKMLEEKMVAPKKEVKKEKRVEEVEEVDDDEVDDDEVEEVEEDEEPKKVVKKVEPKKVVKKK